ncbi:MAG: ferritin-like domain-containing protein [Proteobacteria bacterium]|nr:MAG: ferritin-like domain-containing protein [Pseudomonadota bacterium]
MSVISENDRWLLSFYRTSEISGALFFGRLAKSLPAGPIQTDLTKHFADESQHAWYWTRCLDTLGEAPMKLPSAYQDQYLAAAGMPTNVMEILGITLIFEKRVIGQYNLHRQLPNIHPEIKKTIELITEDEKWHIQWVTNALKGLETEYGEEHVRATLRRFREADQEVYKKTIAEHEDRIRHVLTKQTQSGDYES